MVPGYFMEVKVAFSASGRDSAHLAGAKHELLALAFKVVHAVCSRHDVRHAVAFPGMREGEAPTPGDVLRIFTERREQLDLIADELEKMPFTTQGLQIGRIKSVADQTIVGQVEHRRFRIPGKRSTRTQSRERRTAEAKTLPYLMLTSRTNGQSFSLLIKPLSVEGNWTEPADIDPDAYGLSKPTAPFTLPQFTADVKER